MKTFIVIIFALLTGCASHNKTLNSEFTALNKTDRVTNKTTVSWVILEDAHEFCLADLNAGRPVNEQLNPGNRKIKACSRNYVNACTIFTEKNTSMELLGHELRHCFEGAFHGYD